MRTIAISLLLCSAAYGQQMRAFTTDELRRLGYETQMTGSCSQTTSRWGTPSGGQLAANGGWNSPPRSGRPTNTPIQAPPQPPASQPGPKGDKGDPGEKGADGAPGKDAVVDYQKLADELAAKMPKQPTLDEIVAAVSAKIKPCECKPTEPPSKAEHIVIVAERGASYWSRLGDEVKRAQDVYKGLEVVPPPKNFTGTLPQAVLYENSIPRVIGVGQNQVSSVLSRIGRGDSL